MRIAVNCRSILLNNRTGIGRYTYHLLDALGKVDGHNAYSLYAPLRLFDRKRRLPDFPYKNFRRQVDRFHKGVGPADIYHVPCPDDIGHYEGKLVVTVHDLIYKTYPQAHTQQTIDLTERYMGQMVRRADKIICISDHTREDVHRFFDVPRQKTCAILNGVDHAIFYPIEDLAPAQAFLKTIGVNGGFVLFVGTIEPRKNLAGLLQAMGQLKTAGKKLPHLVVAGMRGWMMEKITPVIEQSGLKDRVIFTGFVTDAQLNMLYNTCAMFVFPSFYEGFGFPIVEAFCAGALVVASKTSSCLQISGDAALLVDPARPDDIAGAIMRLMEDAALAQQLRQKALARAKSFSFEKTARETVNVYEQLCPN
ncbi:MAG: glycosyltransferase family 4 protein [Candidatus Omnitrophica bacterium]|nr:glycosyltransferase family 4 protein [Candidatus Omnitrophota bacterium]